MHDIEKIVLKMMCLRNLLIVLHTSLGWEPPAVCLPFFFFSPHVTPNIVLLDVNSANTMNQKTLKMWATNKLVFPMGQKHLGLGTDSVGPLYETANLFAIFPVPLSSLFYGIPFSNCSFFTIPLPIIPIPWALLSLLAHSGLCTQTTEVVVDVFFLQQCLAE